MPPCHVIRPGQSEGDLAHPESEVGWPAILKPRSAQGSRYTFLARDAAELDRLLDALGPGRPDMVLEGYLADDPGPRRRRATPPTSRSRAWWPRRDQPLALTGRFPLAENFRETGFFIPAALDEGSRRPCWPWPPPPSRPSACSIGCLHTEIKFTPDGPRIIEVNGRVGGGVPEMLERAAGIPLLELTPAGGPR
jgi:hypothetical protein